MTYGARISEIQTGEKCCQKKIRRIISPKVISQSFDLDKFMKNQI